MTALWAIYQTNSSHLVPRPPDGGDDEVTQLTSTPDVIGTDHAGVCGERVGLAWY
jgi:hypothetical protein